MEKPPTTIEQTFNPESEPSPVARVFLVRHGESEYKEYFDENPKNVDFDLTEQGKEEIENASLILSSLINKDNPVRVISSPRIRTLNSAGIISEELKKEHFEIKPGDVKKTETMQGVKTFTDATELWTELTDKYEKLGTTLDKEWREGRMRDDSRLESDIQIQERLRESFIKGIRILRRTQQGSRDLSQTILVTHGETVSAILAAFNLRPFLDPERKVKTGSVSTVNVFPEHVEIEVAGFKYDINI